MAMLYMITVCIVNGYKCPH